MRSCTASTRFVGVLSVFVLLFSVVSVAQSEDEVPLGDVARTARTQHAAASSPVASIPVIDNENLAQAVTDAQKLKADSAPVFSIVPGGKKFQIASPDGTCSLSFNANATALISDPLVAKEVPQSELAKLDGPATINSDTLQLSLYNGTNWNLTEVVIGLTIVRHESVEASEKPFFGQAKLIPAAAADVPVEHSETVSGETGARRSDFTTLYHLKGPAAPLKTTVLQELMAAAIAPGTDWHWAIVSAKGVQVKSVAASPLTPTSQPTMPGSLALPVTAPNAPAALP